jgi:cell division protein FtsI (penicillin-binding protein 3)
MTGTGVKAQVPGYVIGGKTGTAQVVGPRGGYLKHTNNASFMAAFPMNDPQYVIYVLVLQPHADKTTAGFTTGGQIAAPTVGRIIARIGPMLGVLPVSGDALATMEASLTVPMNPTPPPGEIALGPGRPLPPGANMFAYELLGERPPGAAVARPSLPDALLSASHALPGRNGGTIMAPVYPPLQQGAMRHMTENAGTARAGTGEELAER